MDSGGVVQWDDGETSTVIEEVPEIRELRFNDVIADTESREEFYSSVS